jgi:hypothetical protein
MDIPASQASPYPISKVAPECPQATGPARCAPQQGAPPPEATDHHRNGDRGGGDDDGEPPRKPCPLLPVFIRYADLVANGIVGNWPTLLDLIAKQGFPPGQWIGKNTRVWDAAEVRDWLTHRPTARKVVNLGPKPRGRKRKNATAITAEAATGS